MTDNNSVKWLKRPLLYLENRIMNQISNEKNKTSKNQETKSRTTLDTADR